MRQENRANHRASSESRDRERAISQQGVQYHKIASQGHRKPPSPVKKQRVTAPVSKKSKTKTARKDWAKLYPNQHGLACARIVQHCQTYPVEEWTKLDYDVRQGIRREVIEEIKKILPPEWSMRQGRKCAVGEFSIHIQIKSGNFRMNLVVDKEACF